MITDPKTVPASRRGRIAFGVAVAVTSALLIAPQQTEFGAKVGLLCGLVLVCAARPAIDRMREFWSVPPRLAGGPGARSARWRGVAVVATVVIAAGAVAAAGTSARTAEEFLRAKPAQDPRDLVGAVDPARVPLVTVDEDASSIFGPSIGPDPQRVGVELLRALDVEALAVRTGDPALLDVVDHGRRLTEMRELVEQRSSQRMVVQRHHFDTMHLTVLRLGGQRGARLAVEATGTACPARLEPRSQMVACSEEPFASVFALRPGTDGRWFLVDVRPLEVDDPEHVDSGRPAGHDTG